MSDRWNTYAFEFKGGLISNLSPLQHGIQAPGTARTLVNFEPSVEGGYSRILGYEKYSSSIVPEFGSPVVHGDGQTGSTLVIGNIYQAPEVGDMFTVSGVTGVHIITAGGVSYDSNAKRATLTFVPALATSPADKAAVTFTSKEGIVNGLAAWRSSVIAVRNNNVYTSTGSTWTRINSPNYGTVLVNGGSQTGGTLAVDGLTNIPQIGDTFTIASVDLVYTVTALPTVTAGAATLTISPNLDSSPANDAAITFLTANRTSVKRNRFAKYRIATTEKIVGVDGDNYPFIWDGTNYTPINTAPSDVKGAEHVAFFKNQLFFAKGDKLVFTSPYTDTDFNAANGAGVISVGTQITGIIVFREQLIIFSEDKIDRLVGNTLADFVLEPITRNIGCVSSDTIQEVGSDVMFLGPDGLRLLSATDRIGDFNLAVVSKEIQKELVTLITTSQSFSSVVINKKSQYRIFGYNQNTTASSSSGILGTQLAGPEGTVFGWAELRGFKAYVADTDYYIQTETTVFANNTGYVFKMEQGNSLDGANIVATFATPFVPCGDPRLRKTFYKLHLYTDPNGSIDLESSIKLDLNEKQIIQPDEFDISNISSNASFYGLPSATYGTAIYGGTLKRVFETQLIGSGFTVSLQFVSNNTVPPFSLDAALLEFANFDRR